MASSGDSHRRRTVGCIQVLDTHRFAAQSGVLRGFFAFVRRQLSSHRTSHTSHSLAVSTPHCPSNQPDTSRTRLLSSSIVLISSAFFFLRSSFSARSASTSMPVRRLVRLLVQTHEHLGECVHDAALLEVLAELLLLRVGRLDRRNGSPERRTRTSLERAGYGRVGHQQAPLLYLVRGGGAHGRLVAASGRSNERYDVANSDASARLSAGLARADAGRRGERDWVDDGALRWPGTEQKRD